MSAYVDTLRSHWKILLIPVLIAAVIGGWFTFGAAKTYRSTASVWVDDGPLSGSWLDPTVAADGAGQPPATVLQAELTELLDSDRAFNVELGKKSSLPAYLASSPRPKGFSPTVLLSRSSGSSSEEIQQSIDGHVSSTVVGPQVLSLSYTGPYPGVTRSVLSSLLARLESETKQLGVDFSIAEDHYYVRELSSGQKSATSLRDAAAAYLRLHPAATETSDTIYAALLNAARATSAKLAAPAAAIARVARLESGGGTPLVKVIDAPTLPTEPVRGLGAELEGVLAGAFAGLVLSLLVTILLTPMSGIPWDQEQAGPLASAPYKGDWAPRQLT